MSISFRCDHCETSLRVKDAAAGRVIQCPSCKARVTVPEADAVIDEEYDELPPLPRIRSSHSASTKRPSVGRRMGAGGIASAPPVEWHRIAWIGFGALIVIGFVGELARILFVSSPPAALPAPLARLETPAAQTPAAGSPAAPSQGGGPGVATAPPNAPPPASTLETAKAPDSDPLRGQNPPSAPATALPDALPPATIPPVTPPSVAGAPVTGPPATPRAAVNQAAVNRAAGQAGETWPIDVASIPLPAFPDLGPGRPVGARGVTLQTLSFTPPAGAPDAPGGKMKVRVYLPPGQPKPRSVPCVLVAPAGSTLVFGMAIEPGDGHEEALPYAEAGMVVVMYELDGGIGPTENATIPKMSKGYKEFRASGAGVVNGRNALEFTLAKIAIVDPRQIFAAGHSSGGTATLLLAEHETRLQGSIAYAPCTDLKGQLAPFLSNPAIAATVPGLAEFAQWSGPENGADRLKGRIMVFLARDDTTCPFAQTFAFVQRARRQNPNVVLKVVEQGGHYDPMINRGIPAAIGWIKGEPPVYPATPAPTAVAQRTPVVTTDAGQTTGRPKSRVRRRRTIEITGSSGTGPSAKGTTAKRPAGKRPSAREPIEMGTGDAIGWTNKISDIKQIPDTEVAGTIDGIEFTLDQATFEHGRLVFTKGPKFRGPFCEAEVAITVTLDQDQDVSGQKLIINGRPRDHWHHIYMSAMRKDDKIPKGQFVNECVLFLEFGAYDAKARTQPGRIYLCLPDRGKSYLAGAFEARVE
jgi:dienelactone hydrolase